MESCSAKAQPATPVSTESDINSEADSKRRALLTARLGEDRNDAYDYSGTFYWENSDYCTQESCGNCVGCGDK